MAYNGMRGHGMVVVSLLPGSADTVQEANHVIGEALENLQLSETATAPAKGPEGLQHVLLQSVLPGCANCSNHVAGIACNKCSDVRLDDLSGREPPTSYCSQRCLIEHTHLHERKCVKLRQRKLILRAADFVQQIWRTARRFCFDTDIEKVEVSEDLDTIVVHQTKVPEMPPERYLRCFPSHLTDYPDINDAVLMFTCATDAIVWLKPVLEGLLEGQFRKIQHATFKPRNQELHVKSHERSSFLPQYHTMFRVIMKSGKKWVVDPCGVACGWSEPAMLWKCYDAQHVTAPLVWQDDCPSTVDWYNELLTQPAVSLNNMYRYCELREAAIAFRAFNTSNLPRLQLPALRTCLEESKMPYEQYKEHYVESLELFLTTGMNSLYCNSGRAQNDRKAIVKALMAAEKKVSKKKLIELTEEALTAWEIRRWRQERSEVMWESVDASEAMTIEVLALQIEKTLKTEEDWDLNFDQLFTQA